MHISFDIPILHKTIAVLMERASVDKCPNLHTLYRSIAVLGGYSQNATIVRILQKISPLPSYAKRTIAEYR